MLTNKMYSEGWIEVLKTASGSPLLIVSAKTYNETCRHVATKASADKPVGARLQVIWTADGRTSRKGAAAYLGLATGTLANLAVTGRGPLFLKRGNKVWYFKVALDEWLYQGHASSTAQAKQVPQPKQGVGHHE